MRRRFLYIWRNVENIRDKAPTAMLDTPRRNLKLHGRSRGYSFPLQFRYTWIYRCYVHTYIRTYVCNWWRVREQQSIIPSVLFYPYHSGHKLFKLRITTDIWAEAESVVARDGWSERENSRREKGRRRKGEHREPRNRAVRGSAVSFTREGYLAERPREAIVPHRRVGSTAVSKLVSDRWRLIGIKSTVLLPPPSLAALADARMINAAIATIIRGTRYIHSYAKLFPIGTSRPVTIVLPLAS